MANMSLYENAAPAARPLFVVRGADELPLVFLVDAHGHLHLLRCIGADTWSATDLSGALPGDATRREVRCADVRQGADGAISLALALADRDDPTQSSLHVATDLSPALDDSGWLDVLRNLHPRADLPAGTNVQRLAFGPMQAGAPPLLLVSATLQGQPATWYCNAAAPQCGLRPLAVPSHVLGACAYAVGTYRLPGVWALHPDGREGELRFASFIDPFGWKVEMSYPNLPARTASVYLAPGSVPNVPDLFAAGDRIVVYRGSNNVPQLVANVDGARLLWSAQNGAGEFLAYADARGALWMVSRPARGAWDTPYLLTERRAVLTATGDGMVRAVALEDDQSLSVLCFDVHGQRLGCDSVNLAVALVA